MNFTDRLSLRLKIFIALVGMILSTAVIIGVVTFFHFQRTSKEYHEDRLARKEKTIIETIDYAITDYPEEASPRNLKEILETKIFEFSDINDIPITLYNLSGDLVLTSEAKISNQRKKVPGLILTKISKNNDRFEVKKTVQDKTFLTTYSYVYGLDQKPLAIVSLPYEHDDSFLKEELISLLERFLGIVVGVLILGAAVSWWISKSITRRLNEIAKRLQETHVVRANKPIKYKYNDEVSTLVNSYNDMVGKMNEQSEQLLKVEREETWREAARQVAHELKNPLTPMRLQMQNFQRKFDPQDPEINYKVNELSKGIIKQIDTLSGIAEAFSDYTKMPVRKDKTINLSEEIDTALELFDEDTITLNIPPKDIYLNFDPNYLTRVITNLVKNANQAVPVGRKPKVQIDVKEDGKYVKILLKDNGTGISDEVSKKLFEPKFTTKSSGSGLGLPMVKKIIEDYNGTIRFKNNPDMGATFIITLPLNK